ncbi:MAG: tetratricopeptide repeat protein [Myxococcales bacterium]|nr:tetratricopeptide repeat protein [Myxococcales bacterium]
MSAVEAGQAFLRARNPAAALASFREAVELEPADAGAWRGMVRASLELRIWREAATCLAQLESLTSDRADLAVLMTLRGQILDLHLAETPQARDLYEKALMYQPDRLWLYLALAEIDLRQRRWSRGIAHTDHGLELCSPSAAERPWLLLVKAVASQRISVSMGPQSTFFRGLRGSTTGEVPDDPGERAYRQAARHLPELAGLGYRAWLEDETSAMRFIRERMPRPSLHL